MRNRLTFLISNQINHDTISQRVKIILHRLHLNPDDDYSLEMFLCRYAEEPLIHKSRKHLMLIYYPDR